MQALIHVQKVALEFLIRFVALMVKHMPINVYWKLPSVRIMRYRLKVKESVGVTVVKAVKLLQLGYTIFYTVHLLVLKSIG